MRSRRVLCVSLLVLCFAHLCSTAPIVLLGYEGDQINRLIRALKQKLEQTRSASLMTKAELGDELDYAPVQKRPFLVGMGPYWRPPKSNAIKKDSA
uniref:Uncharacterized protein n=1 Tax=Plectus sambesii TaxID=2011161 RepID=A0A914XDJ8_9BILA